MSTSIQSAYTKPAETASGMINYNVPDLTRHPPRSPRSRLGGYAHLPRLIDKARAEAAGLNGDFHYIWRPRVSESFHGKTSPAAFFWVTGFHSRSDAPEGRVEKIIVRRRVAVRLSLTFGLAVREEGCTVACS